NSKKFSIEEAQGGEIDITVRSADNRDKVVEVEDDDETDDIVLYTAQIEAEDGDNLIEEITVDLSTTTSTDTARIDNIIRTLYLFIDGDEVGSESVEGWATSSVTFDDIDFDLDEGDEVEVQVIATIDE